MKERYSLLKGGEFEKFLLKSHNTDIDEYPEDYCRDTSDYDYDCADDFYVNYCEYGEGEFPCDCNGCTDCARTCESWRNC